MKKEYLVMVQHAYQVSEGRWTNVRRTVDYGTFYRTKAEAQDALKKYLAKWNKTHVYDANGKRRETNAIGGGFAADMVLDKKLDDSNRVVSWKIRVRQVTEWETVLEVTK